MTSMEARVLKRASFLVLALCSLRMAVAGVRRPLLEPDPGSEDGATLAELLEESAETRDEDRRRGRPRTPEPGPAAWPARGKTHGKRGAGVDLED